MMRVLVASTNPVKIEATRRGLRAIFPNEEFEVRWVSAPSGVSDQPMGDAETLLGAQNRAASARKLMPDVDFCIGIEGGVSDEDGEMQAFAWVVILGKTRTGKSRTGTFLLPQEVAQLVREGMELGHADDVVFGRDNSKQANGSVGLLTGDVIDRVAYYEHAVVLALIPFKQAGLTF
jgi:inosine/xanthosine triphosphatase